MGARWCAKIDELRFAIEVAHLGLPPASLVPSRPLSFPPNPQTPKPPSHHASLDTHPPLMT
ncbi:BZ3500_MvSof-1268-A1-R1_Chr3-3g06470 [Microbotryum saponariae]|uniref:BZ3500_MvSof-1268-A1-R1_Chr3-3g06470 protein n=1 Tax=Microbotryum saponariae TaxID=289078 RepID=A0A2X0NH29_9BASI|nr:BZ3500_MvSof-1268-A1-R1_Chr3-3g06470 [Microbotryum saponariae]SDA04437.1 BZ3501_MvSof-1269-A2-R1_Chr3-2g06157 [Microbotryum saponariae]